MSAPQSLRDPWVVRSVGAVAAVLIGAVVLGFMVFPLIQAHGRAESLWDAICSAAGVARQTSSEKPVEPDFKLSDAVMTSNMLRGADAESIGRGATLAHQCAICHGPTGVRRADSPNLAGQYASVIYKELKDFQTGARVNAVMSPFAQHLSDQDMVDLAAYYAYLPRLPAYHPVAALPLPRIVINGAPLRGIAPCAPLRLARPAARHRALRRLPPRWTTRSEAPGSKVNPPSISNPSLRLSHPARGGTTSASKCATSRGG